MALDEPQAEETLAPGEQRLGTAAIIMVAATFGSAIVGLIRAMVYSREFGTTPAFNAYLQAVRIPDLSYFLIAGGVLRAGFIPVFTKFTATGRWEKAWRTFSVTFFVMAIFGVLTVTVGMLGAPWFGKLVAPGLDPYHQELCGRFMRTMFPAQLFFIVGGLLMGTLNARRHFTMPAWGPIVYNIVIITGALASLPIAEHAGIGAGPQQLVYRLWVLSIFVVIGAALGNVVMQIPPLARLGAKLVWVFDLRDEGLKNLILLSLPVILGLAVSEINFVVTTLIGTLAGDRAVSLLEYPNRLVKLPPRIFGAGLAIALFPVLATHYAKGMMREYRRDLGVIMRSTMFLSIPSTIISVALAAPIIRMFFEGKEFSAADTHDAAQVLLWSALGIVPLSIQYIVARGFYALHETRTPLWVGLATAALNAGLSLLVYRPFGVLGLAGVSSVAALFNAAFLSWMLKRKVGLMEGRRMAAMLARMAVPSLLLGAVCFGGVAAITRSIPAERKVAAARPALLALAGSVRDRKLGPDAAQAQAQEVVEETGAAPFVRLRAVQNELSWEERAYDDEARRRVEAALPGLRGLARQVQAGRMTPRAALTQGADLLAQTGAKRYIALQATPAELRWDETSLSGPLKALACLGPMLLGSLLFVGLCVVFKVEEMRSAWNLATARFRRKKPAETDPSLIGPDDPE
jgi:putative peptidoglycan lipid II flippase